MRKPQCAAKRRNSLFSRSLPDLALIVDDDCLQLIEEELCRHPAKGCKGLLQPAHQHRHGLARVEPQPHQPRVSEHHQQREALAPG